MLGGTAGSSGSISRSSTRTSAFSTGTSSGSTSRTLTSTWAPGAGGSGVRTSSPITSVAWAAALLTSRAAARARVRRRARRGSRFTVLLREAPQHGAWRLVGSLDRRRQLAAHVTVVPGLVSVTALVLGAAGVAHHEAVAPGVGRHPGALGGGRPVVEVPGGRAEAAAQVDGGAQLVLGVAGAGAGAQRDVVAVDLHPVGEGALLVGVRAVGRLHGEAHPGRLGVGEQRLQGGHGHRPQIVAGGGQRPVGVGNRRR